MGIAHINCTYIHFLSKANILFGGRFLKSILLKMKREETKSGIIDYLKAKKACCSNYDFKTFSICIPISRFKTLTQDCLALELLDHKIKHFLGPFTKHALFYVGRSPPSSGSVLLTGLQFLVAIWFYEISLVSIIRGRTIHTATRPELTIFFSFSLNCTI